MKDFVKIQEKRIRKAAVKKYCPLGEDKLNIYYSTSRYKTELETFKFDTKEERDDALYELDNILL